MLAFLVISGEYRIVPPAARLSSRRSLAFACPLDMLMPSAPQAHPSRATSTAVEELIM